MQLVRDALDARTLLEDMWRGGGQLRGAVCRSPECASHCTDRVDVATARRYERLQLFEPFVQEPRAEVDGRDAGVDGGDAVAERGAHFVGRRCVSRLDPPPSDRDAVLEAALVAAVHPQFE